MIDWLILLMLLKLRDGVSFSNSLDDDDELQRIMEPAAGLRPEPPNVRNQLRVVK